MKLVGILLIVNALAVFGWVAATSNGNKWMFSVCALAVFAGFVLILEERLTELTIPGIGSLKAKAETKLMEIEQIRARAEAQSATIDLVAREAKEAKQLAEEIRKNNEDAEEKIKKMDCALEKATTQTEKISLLLDFNNTVISANNDDRKAFDRLRLWSSDNSFQYAKEAAQAYQKIMDDHSGHIMIRNTFIPWKEGVDPSKLDIHGLAREYAAAPPNIRYALLDYIWKRNDISKQVKMDFMMQVMRTDLSIKAVESAGQFFVSGAGLNFKPLAVDYLYNWWQNNRDTIKD